MMGAVSTGHPLTTDAACDVLKKGGNAFDAALAAGFAATVAEPILASLGGGGFLLAHVASTGEDILFDFFVNSPGRGRIDPVKPKLIPVEVRFRSTVQVFHIGEGAVAVPGVLEGFIHFYQRLCNLDIGDIVAPALRYLEEGVPVNDIQAYLTDLLEPILTYSGYGREIYGERGKGMHNPLLREFLSLRSPDQWIARYREAVEDMERGGLWKGVLTYRDIEEYEVAERRPLIVPYRGHEVVTNPPPAFGGSLLEGALTYLNGKELSSMGTEEAWLTKVRAMEMMQRLKNGPGGTTHISVMDIEGNAVSMTISNGSNSGCFLGNTGIMLNNMMGEDDLHPGGFYSLPAGVRVPSMMSPSFIRSGGDIHAVFGSGGSKRIRSAMLQVIVNLIDEAMDVRNAVEAPRVHLCDDGVVQIEPGLDERSISMIDKHYPVNLWAKKDMYFGGVHTVMGDLTGWGDSRRSGVFKRID